MSSAHDNPSQSHATTVPAGPSEALMDLLSCNAQFARTHDFAPLQAGQHPKTTMLCCSDSRVPESSCGETLNRVFTIKDIGNQIATAPGSIMYGTLHLHTPVLLILGHTGCGAIAAALSDYSAEPQGIREELDSLQPVIKAGLQKHGNPGKDINKLAKFSEDNVDYQVQQALADARIKERVSSGKLAIVGAVYDLHALYGKAGSIVVTNVNGQVEGSALGITIQRLPIA